MIKYNNLKFPPLKPQKLPAKLISSISYKNDNGAKIYKFTMFPTNNKEKGLTTLRCFPVNLSVKNTNSVIPSLYISYLYSTVKDKGFGTAILNFAKVFSKKLSCGGNLYLYAATGNSPNRIPHIFYRKYGMTSNDARIDKKLDKFIKRKKDAKHTDFNSMPMYYFANRPADKKQKFLDFFKVFN